MTKETKDGLRQIAISAATLVVGLLLTALIKGENLAGLMKAAALLHLLQVGIPLWLFLIFLVIAVLASVHWIRVVLLRKETLQVAWKPEQCLWGTGSHGSTPMMQIIASGYWTNTARDHRLIITSVYLQGTKPVVGMFEPIQMEPQTCGSERVDAYVEPVVGKQGETYRGKMILVDQFGIKHKVPIELRSMMPKEADKPKTTASS